MSLIRLQNISRVYQMGAETIYALRDVSLEIERGRMNIHPATTAHLDQSLIKFCSNVACAERRQPACKTPVPEPDFEDAAIGPYLYPCQRKFRLEIPNLYFVESAELLG